MPITKNIAIYTSLPDQSDSFFMDAEKLADKARKSIGSYCMNECKAYCCRKGRLVLSEGELACVTQQKHKSLIQSGVITAVPKGHSMNLGILSAGCPSLKDNKCIIYKDPRRPLACHEFPIFVRDENVFISKRCFAVAENKLYAYETKFKQMGMKVTVSNERMNLDIF